jgi:hypothetical protein
VYVLDKNGFPAVLLEFGYINNKQDLDFITDKSNEEKLARAILNSISKFVNSKTISPQEKTPIDTPKRKTPDSVVVKGNIKISQYGPTSVNDSSKVLMVLDGKIIDNISINQLDQQIKPESIESITVLKNESAISKYGEKAKNGVIEIITKKQIKVKEVTLTDNSKQPIKTSEVTLWDKGTTFDNKVFVKVEVEPSFPGGAKAWESFLTKNLNSKTPKEKGAKTGIYKVIVQFIVDKNGCISTIRALSKNGYGMEEEAIRVISNSPKWVPAMQNGRVVNAYKTQPVFLVINPEEVKSKLIAPNTK